MIIDCVQTLSYADRTYNGSSTRDHIEPGRKIGKGRIEHCEELVETVTVARVPGFPPKVVVRLIDKKKTTVVYIREGIFDEESETYPPRLERLLAGRVR